MQKEALGCFIFSLLLRIEVDPLLASKLLKGGQHNGSTAVTGIYLEIKHES